MRVLAVLWLISSNHLGFKKPQSLREITSLTILGEVIFPTVTSFMPSFYRAWEDSTVLV